MGFSIMVRHWIGVLIRYCKCIQLCLCVRGDKWDDWCFSPYSWLSMTSVSVTGELGSMTQSEFPRGISHTLLLDKCDTERLISSTGIHNNSPNLYGYNRLSFADFSRHNYVALISFPVIILCDHVLGGYFLVGNKRHITAGSYPFIATVRKGKTS